MVVCKFNVMHVEYDTLNVFPVRHDKIAYSIVDNKCGDYSVIDIPVCGHLCVTGISYKAVFRGKNIPTSIY